MEENRRTYLKNYKKEKLKRVPLEMKIEDYNRLAAAALEANEPVNTYIKKAIAERMAKNT